MPLVLEIVTPESRAYSDTADTVVIPTTTGEIGILPGHLPLLTQVEPGELRLDRNGKTEYLAVGRGFAQISGDKVSILAESAISEEKIDESAVEDAMKRAQAALATKEALEPAEMERLECLVRFSSAQLLVKRKKR
jgi:F-type H+-transporting ATPase subunit epsilon